MRLSKKRNCNGCKAGVYEIQPFYQKCELGYKVTSKNFTGIPLESCYKPLTNDDYMSARRILYPLKAG